MSIVFVMYNMFLAIIYENYSNIRLQIGDSMGLGMQMRESLSHTLWYIWWRFDQFRSREPVGKSLREILDDLLVIAQASDEVSKSTETSVLGQRLLKHKTENLRFKQKTTMMDIEEDLNDPLHAPSAKEDLKEMKVDKELAERLIDGCRAFFARQPHPQETRVAQMRDLVKQAEEGFSAISNRFEQCEENVTKILYDVSHHVTSLEHTSHSTLAELFRTAQDVGIPEAASNRGPSKDIEQRVISHLYQEHGAARKRRPGARTANPAMQKIVKMAKVARTFRSSRASISSASPTHEDQYERTI